MRTKTLILSAAALAAGLLSSQAQVYSANVVGYYNVVIPAHGAGNQIGMALVANQLVGSGGSNSVSTQLKNGLPTGMVLLMYNKTLGQFVTHNFFSDADAAPDPGGWYDATLVTDPLDQGFSAYIQNPYNTNVTMTVIGEVRQGSVTNQLSASPTAVGGQNFYAVPFPVVTNIDSTIVHMPSTTGDTYLHWNKTTQSYDNSANYFSAADAAPDPAGWYTSVQVFPTPVVGEGFLIQHLGGNSNWISSFTVQ